MYNTYPLHSLKITDLFKINGYTVALFLSVTSYVGLRLFWGYQHGLCIPMYDVLQCFMDNIPYMGIAAWTYFQELWLMILITVIIGILKYPGKALNYIIIYCSIPHIFGTFMIGDLTRNCGYCFPIVFICLFLLKNLASITEIRMLVLFSAIICILFPTLNVARGNIERWALSANIPSEVFEYF